MSPFFRSAVVLAGSALALASCTDSAPAPATTTPTGQANSLTGLVLDTQGHPIAGAKVRAENDVTHSFAEVRTDGTGRYSFPKLEFGGWKVYAWKEATYKGQPYTLRLGMPNAADYDAFGTGSQGAVRNFRWQLAGRIPDRTTSANTGVGYFGGTMRFVNFDADFRSLPAGTEVTVTLTPVAGATLFDGSAPQTVRRSFTVVDSSPAQYNYWLHDIPQCDYRVTAESRFNGTTRALVLSPSMTDPYQPAIASNFFRPTGSGSYESGLGEPQVPAIYIR
jgi:hypothetical protein